MNLKGFDYRLIGESAQISNIGVVLVAVQLSRVNYAVVQQFGDR